MDENLMNGKALSNAKGMKVQECKAGSRVRGTPRVLMTAGAIVAAVLLIGITVSPLCAQSYPNKPIRFILPMAPGGAVDILGRIIGSKLAERLGQPVVPENRPGAGGNVGLEFAAKAKPDGYTIVMGNPGLATSPGLYTKLSFDPIKDFAPISLISQVHLVLIVHPSLPVKNLKELIEYAKANPGKLNYGSTGIGSVTHLANELLKTLVKIDTVHVPYKSAGPALIGLMSGEVGMQALTTTAAMAQIQAGKVRALAVLSNGRAPSLPNVPTAKEAGVDNWEVTIWYGILAPAGTPRDIVTRLNAEWVKIAAMPDVIEKMRSAGGAEPLSGTPEQFSEFIKTETVRWAKVIKEANLKID